MTDVAQVYGAPLLYALVLLAALGMRRFAANLPALLVALVVPVAPKVLPHDGIAERYSVAFWLLCAAAASGVLLAARSRLSIDYALASRCLRSAWASSSTRCIFSTASICSTWSGPSPSHYRFLERNGLLMGSADRSFPTPTRSICVTGFRAGGHPCRLCAETHGDVGRDLMEHRKSAFPNVMRKYTDPPDEFRRLPDVGPDFLDAPYYDYLVNVDPDRQLAFSGVTCR